MSKHLDKIDETPGLLKKVEGGLWKRHRADPDNENTASAWLRVYCYILAKESGICDLSDYQFHQRQKEKLSH